MVTIDLSFIIRENWQTAFKIKLESISQGRDWINCDKM